MANVYASPSYQGRRACYTYTLRRNGDVIVSRPYRTKRAAFDALYRAVDMAEREARAQGDAGLVDDLVALRGGLASMGYRMGRGTLPWSRSGAASCAVSRRSPVAAAA